MIFFNFFFHFVRYHGAKIRKLKVLVNGMLVDNPTSRYWRETGEFHLKPGLLQDYHTRKSSAALCLSGIQKRFSDGISDWARKWALPQDLCHRLERRVGKVRIAAMKKVVRKKMKHQETAIHHIPMTVR
jgi:hypothetical protein